jgi:hypothetical protein
MDQINFSPAYSEKSTSSSGSYIMVLAPVLVIPSLIEGKWPSLIIGQTIREHKVNVMRIIEDALFIVLIVASDWFCRM